jgi:hypothetical protein
MRSKLIFLILFLPCILIAQSSPFGYHAKWTFSYDEFGFYGIDSIYHESDSTFLGKDWLVIRRPNTNFSFYTHTQNDSVFYYENGAERLLFVRNAPVNFSWKFAYFSDAWGCVDTPQATIVQENIQVLQGVSLRSLTLENIKDTLFGLLRSDYRNSANFVYYNRIYDWLGYWPSNILLQPSPNLCDWGLKTETTWSHYSLRCYQDDSISVNFTGGACNSGLHLEPLPIKKFIIYPNPSNGFFEIESDEKIKEVIASNLLGQQFSIQKTGNLYSLPPVSGLYLITVFFEDGSRRVQRLVRK